MYLCNCGKEFLTSNSFNGHRAHCKSHSKVEKKSIYKINELYVCECGKEFKKSQSINAHFSHCLIHRKGKPILDKFKGKQNWSKGLTKDTDNRIKNQNNAWKKGLAEGKFKPNRLGKKLSPEVKQLLSLKASSKNNGYVKTKYYEIFCPHENKNVKVQGTWEFKYAQYLNENDIKWQRPSNPLHYKIENDYFHSYYPDFYLPDNNEFVEIKGYWWKGKDGRVDDKRKMELVISQNSDKKIIILEFNDLKELKIL